MDRDGTLIVEPPDDFQVGSLEKLEFLPGVFRNLYRIKKQMDFELVIVSNQDGLGSKNYPEEIFIKVQTKMLQAFNNEGVEFDRIFIDRSLPEDNLSTRKPGIGMLGEYLTENYDLANSFVIGDRLTDIKLARNLGAKGILLGNNIKPEEIQAAELQQSLAFIAEGWEQIYDFLRKNERFVSVERITGETTIHTGLSLDGTGQSDISTGLGFLDHMLEQL